MYVCVIKQIRNKQYISISPSKFQKPKSIQLHSYKELIRPFTEAIIVNVLGMSRLSFIILTLLEHVNSR